MDTKRVRLSAEHAASCSDDCARFVETLLAVVDADVETGQRTFQHEILHEAAARLERLTDELDALKQQLVTLRYSDSVKRALPPELAIVEHHAFRLHEALQGVLPRAFVFARAARIGSVPANERAGFEQNARAHLELMNSIAERCDAASWDRSFTVPALSRLRSLHAGIPFEQAEELETRRWRD